MTEPLLQLATRLGLTRQQAERMLEDAIAEHGEEKGPEKLRRELEARMRRVTLRSEMREARRQQNERIAKSHERFDQQRTREVAERPLAERLKACQDRAKRLTTEDMTVLAELGPDAADEFERLLQVDARARESDLLPRALNELPGDLAIGQPCGGGRRRPTYSAE